MKPKWLKQTFFLSPKASEVTRNLREFKLATICEQARCPNKGYCYSKGRATFMILGEICTRNCGFCSVKAGAPDLVDPQEPEHLARVIETLNLKHVVITSVTRDDLDDGGAGQFRECIEAIKTRTPECKVEVLIPDFKGDQELLKLVVDSQPDILNHNIETIERLYPSVRKEADYHRSLDLIKSVKGFCDNGIFTKSGFMVGLGETDDEVFELMRDLREHDCDIVTIGQYLQPTRSQLPVERYVHPDTFEQYREWGEELEFKAVYSGPLVRSSFQADTIWEKFEKEHN